MLWNLCSLSQCFSVQVFQWQYFCLHWRFSRNIRHGSRKKSGKVKLVNDLYQMISVAINKEDEAVVYQTLEMLKLSFGEKVVFADGAGKLTALCVVALQKKQYAIVGHILDAYQSFIKNADSESVEEILQGLILVISVAKKFSQEYVLGKAANCVFSGITKLVSTKTGDFNHIVDVLKTVGLNAIKMSDAALFQHTARCLLKIPLPVEKEKQARLHLLIGVWLHQMIKRDDSTLLQIFFQLVESLLAEEQNGFSIADCISQESDNLVGIIGVNHKMQCKLAFIHFLLKTAQGSGQNMRHTAYNIGRMARITSSLHGMRKGFDVLLPLLEIGRMYLNKELRFIRLSNEAHLKILYAVMNELTLAFELAARQDGRMTGTDVLMTFKEYWLSYYKKEANQKSVNQFCQLLLKQMITARKRRTRNLCIGSKNLLDYALFDDSQIKKLGLG